MKAKSKTVFNQALAAAMAIPLLIGSAGCATAAEKFKITSKRGTKMEMRNVCPKLENSVSSTPNDNTRG